PIVFRFSGIATDQTRYETEDLHLERCSHRDDEQSRHWLDLEGSCLSGVFHRPLITPTELPVLQMHLRGLETFRSHEETCQLGTVSIGTHKKDDDPNVLSGSIRIHATKAPEDLESWREKAAALAEHVRRVMSLAAASLLRSPITEFFAGETVE